MIGDIATDDCAVVLRKYTKYLEVVLNTYMASIFYWSILINMDQ